ncbi:hypothetical protein PHYSODRAFT_262301 [Phytophthora sojae]|uniref:pectin lyase n=1 Tax=Phytophthora sojae (strain P6497) TaxID=1094619 RepID=G4ZUL2_PHYSP|nr:hypothetical protein PHYSODRAFT_262301 [Phytophthora sojae]EGZ13486.1 hypothetical protein PHYSODRAFT_262301 [Phytophthora sojae]|eukprot:XP_009530915.1 hypothetical protein PHYSODRAFT_262301 [Phytophthora sojae]
MGHIQLALAAALAFVAKDASAFNIGSPAGMAAGTTGGEGGEVVYPTSTSELIQYLNDTEPLVIVLNQTFDFRGTEGSTTEMGCRPENMRKCLAKNNGFKGQDVILGPGGMNNTGGCTNGTEIEVTYDNAAQKRMNVKGNKTVRGVGKKGVIMGKGMTLNGDNIIIQNVHVTELNPHGNTTAKNIWLDHVKVSRVGRQMVVTNKAGVDSLTISNSDFDGNTEYSSSCDGHHYWTFLFYGKNTGISMLNNYIHATSGRSPKVGGNKNENIVVHIASNYWGDNSGHSFEIGANAYVLAEGNYFNNTKQPLDPKGSDGNLYATDSNDVCSNYLTRSCKSNTLVSSGNFTSRNGPAVLEAVKANSAITGYSASSAQTEQQSSQTNDSEQQEQYTPGTAKPSTETTQSFAQASDLADVWAQTTDNFGVGKLD